MCYLKSHFRFYVRNNQLENLTQRRKVTKTQRFYIPLRLCVKFSLAFSNCFLVEFQMDDLIAELAYLLVQTGFPDTR